MDQLISTVDEHVRQPSAQFGGCELYVQQFGSCTIIRLVGELDISNAAPLQHHLSDIAREHHVVVDLPQLEFIDSSGLAVLIQIRLLAQRRGTSLHLAGAGGTVLEVLRISGLDRELNHHADVADAIEAALESRDGLS